MRVEATSVLSPVFGAVIIWASSYAIGAAELDPIVVATILTFGSPVAIVLAVVTSIYLRNRLLTDGWLSFVWCSFWGGFLATVICIILIGTGPLAIALVAWGLLSGFLYRLLSGSHEAISID